MFKKIQLRRDTAENWENVNPILSSGELGVDLTSKKIKLGDGSTQWNELDYLTNDAVVDLTGYATEEYVDQAIAAIDIPEPTDLTGYATEEYVDQAIAAINLPDVSNFITAEDIPAIPNDINDLSDNDDLLKIKDYLELTQRINFVPDSEVSFEKVLGVTEFDEIDNDVVFTRSIASIELEISAGGIYNSALEESYNQSTSPAGTLWNGDGWDNLDNIKSRTYTPLRETLKGSSNFKNNILNTDLVMWDTINNKYYTFRFFRWDQGAQHDGGFGYTRNLIDTTQQLGITFADGSVQYSASRELTKYPQTYVGNTSGFEIRSQDAGHHILVLGQNITLPNERELPVPLGTIIKVVTGPLNELYPNLTTIVPKSYVGENSATIVKQFLDPEEPCVLPERSICTLIKTAKNTWQITGVPSALSFYENDANFITADDVPTDISDLTDEQSLLSASTTQPYLELTNVPFITRDVILDSPISFVRTALGNETDSIDVNLTLARGSQGALYNIDLEVEYDRNNHTSPAGTEWNAEGWGDLLNLQSRSYSTLRSVLNNSIGNNIIGVELVMHDTINDKYYKFIFTDWGVNNGGSFAYTRTLITDPNYFKKEDNATVNDVDVIEDDSTIQIGITRGVNQGIYNPFTEEGWNSDVSPEGTLWNIDGWDDLTNIETRTYNNFYAAYGNGGLGNKVPGSNAVMYVPSINKYYAIQWLSWTPDGNGGGFSYIRKEIDLTKLNEGLRFADGTTLKSAEGLGRVKSTASANRRIEEASGYKEVNVTEKALLTFVAQTSRSATDGFIIWLDSAIYTDISTVINDPDAAGISDNSTIQFSIDNVNWYSWNGGTSFSGTERGYGINQPVSYTVGDTLYFRYVGGGAPQVWWNKADLPGGLTNFRGAVIDYHAYTGEATWIGTIHIVDDDGDNNIAHTEVSSGSTDSENDDLWLVDNEGTIKYRRIDGEAKTLKIHWTAKVFYGSETYD
jgi:hypothetical protein